ncbi:hypothetical protein GTW43_05755 [Streptomyces sp. SID5785]|uniref:hypothetical protein n=1 Tax=Streptomyces sp. SID5785 TaxID=2690309 RepID=UPI001361121F|nr:hypothetical protein [Streptomyces sp. SID5785]MZD04588.1 hypothetical protein [Streptomyces sp. SID5785]
MSAFPVRPLAGTLLCASLLIGAAAPVLAAGPATEPASRTDVASAPVPGADALLAQTKTLHDTGGVLTPVTELLDAVLKADDGKLSAADATKHADAVKAAIAAAAAKAPAAPSTPDAAALPKAAKAPADVKSDALAALQSAVDALLKSATAGDPAAVATQAPVVVTGLVNVVAATLLAGGLPAPNLPGLPALPQLPTSSLPSTDSLPEAPALPATPLAG